MKLDVSDLKSALGARLEDPINARLAPIEMEGEVVRFPEPLIGKVEAMHAGDGNFHVGVALEGVAELRCARCLSEYRLPLRLQFDEEFRPGEARTGYEGEQQEEDGSSFTNYQGETIDLTEVVRQNALLELPMKPLCRDDCQGLCPQCGANLNSGACNCAPSVSDPRLAKLKDFFKES